MKVHVQWKESWSGVKGVLKTIISENQKAFVEGQQILDASLIANEAVDSMLKCKEAGLVCKLDIEKAFDHMHWEFRLRIPQRMGFGQIGLIG